MLSVSPEPAWSGCCVRRRCSAPWSRRPTECPAAASAGATYEACPSAIGAATTGGRRSSATTSSGSSVVSGAGRTPTRSTSTGTSALARVASLWGPSVEELSAAKPDVADPRFPLVACAHAEKTR
jgi:hypothetical protein